LLECVKLYAHFALEMESVGGQMLVVRSWVANFLD